MLTTNAGPARVNGYLYGRWRNRIDFALYSGDSVFVGRVPTRYDNTVCLCNVEVTSETVAIASNRAGNLNNAILGTPTTISEIKGKRKNGICIIAGALFLNLI